MTLYVGSRARQGDASGGGRSLTLALMLRLRTLILRAERDARKANQYLNLEIHISFRIFRISHLHTKLEFVQHGVDVEISSFGWRYIENDIMSDMPFCDTRRLKFQL
jgi:hypothetical protein